MSFVIEMTSNTVGDLSTKRMTMSRAPSLHEEIRILSTVNGLTTAILFRVERVVHNANTDEYPRRPDELDAWIKAIKI